MYAKELLIQQTKLSLVQGHSIEINNKLTKENRLQLLDFSDNICYENMRAEYFTDKAFTSRNM